MEEKDIKKPHTIQEGNTPDQIKGKKVTEISEEALEERLLLSGLLFKKTEDLAKEALDRKKKREEEEFELHSGKKISIRAINDFVTAHRQPYSAKFPNDNPFFKNMFRLHPALYGLDPNNYIKPPLAGKLLKHLTYDRFGVEILPALVVLAMPDGIKIDKCHQYLTPKGVEKFIQYRNEANDMMGKFADLQWYEFNFEYCKRYKLVCQPRMF